MKGAGLQQVGLSLPCIGRQLNAAGYLGSCGLAGFGFGSRGEALEIEGEAPGGCLGLRVEAGGCLGGAPTEGGGWRVCGGAPSFSTLH